MQSKYIVKFGQTGDLVSILQDALGLKQDGVFGHVTKQAVRLFQIQHKIQADSIVGHVTWLKLGINPLELDADTDITTSATWIEQYNLPEGEYVNEIDAKRYIFISVNNGQHSPYKVIDRWASDQRGRVGAHYVIGGLATHLDVDKLSVSDGAYDGKVLQAIKDENRGFHLGRVKSHKLIKHSISIELCSAGYLKEKGGKYFTWYDQEVHPSQVVRLEKSYRGYRYFHKYSQNQLDSLEALLKLLCEKHEIYNHSIDINKLRISGVNHFDDAIESDLKVSSRDVLRSDTISISPQSGLLDVLSRFTR
jgi:N-acetyl-anhydromuramyl-L-alanine amidase AmpD